MLSRLTGVDVTAIWQWGFVERVSTGLYTMQLGQEGGAAFLEVADRWASDDPAVTLRGRATAELVREQSAVVGVVEPHCGVSLRRATPARRTRRRDCRVPEGFGSRFRRGAKVRASSTI